MSMDSSNKAPVCGTSKESKTELGSSKDNAAAATDDETNCRRLWIGNLDLKLTEFHLLKLVQQYGEIDHFDFLFHRTPGPNYGLPRGYAFVTFKQIEDAEKCLKKLNGKKVLDKFIAVRWAQQTTYNYPDEEDKIKERLKMPALGDLSSTATKGGSGARPSDKQGTSGAAVSKDRKIQDIEAKLKAMEREALTFNLTGTGASKKEGGTKCAKPSGNVVQHVHAYPRQNLQRPHYNKPYTRRKY